MKKYISIILAVVLSICGLSACGHARFEGYSTRIGQTGT